MKCSRCGMEHMRTCEICGTDENLHRHRILPGRANGEYNQDNVMIVCRGCHGKIHSMYRKLKCKTFREFLSACKTVKLRYKCRAVANRGQRGACTRGP